MLSFVVQNYSNHTPFLTKTLRYLTLLKSTNTLLVVVFLKFTVNISLTNQYFRHTHEWLKYFYNEQFTKSFWKVFKKIWFRKFGIYSNNLIKSSLFWTFRSFIQILFTKKQNPQLCTVWRDATKTSLLYYKPLRLVTFAFQNQTFNPLMIYLLFMLPASYLTILSTFQLNYGFLLLQPNFHLYQFLNEYYFRVRNY